MRIDRTSPSVDIVDVLDRVLDKGIVIDAWMRMSVGGIELLTLDASVVIASIETYLTRSSVLPEVRDIAAPLTGRGSAHHPVRTGLTDARRGRLRPAISLDGWAPSEARHAGPPASSPAVPADL